MGMCDCGPSYTGRRRHDGAFLDRLAGGLVHAMDHALDADDLSRRNGLLQRLDPRVKLAGLLGLIVVAVFVKSLIVLGGLFVVAVALALPSQIGLSRLLTNLVEGPRIHYSDRAARHFSCAGNRRRALACPAVAGHAARGQERGLSARSRRNSGDLRAAADPHHSLAARLEGAQSFSRPDRAGRHSRHDPSLHLRLSRIGVANVRGPAQPDGRSVDPRDRRRVATATAGALLDKALHLSTDVQSAMVSRGYRGEVRLIDDFQTTPIDWLALAGFAAIASAALWLQA